MSILSQYIFTLYTLNSTYKQNMNNNRVKVNKLNINYKNPNRLNK